MAALAKVLAICAGTVGGAAACVATGVVPAPLLAPPDHHSHPVAKVARHPRGLVDEGASQPTYEPAPPTESEAELETPVQGTQPAAGQETKKPKPNRESTRPAAEVPASAPPPSEAGAVEYTEPAPAPPPTTQTNGASPSTASSSAASASSSGTAAGEFGP